MNSPAGSDRSNVAWGFGGNYLSGDTFNISGSNSYLIDDFTVWYVNSALDPNDTDFSLYIGSDSGQSLNDVSGAWTTSTVQYAAPDANGFSSYQGSGSGYINITQLTFTDLNLNVASNTDYYFTVSALDITDNLITPLFLHASNEALSGSTQEDADDLYSWFGYNAGVVEWGGFLDSDGYGWDKSSDINVQITGAVVPLPGAAGLGLLGLGLVGLRRRFRRSA